MSEGKTARYLKYAFGEIVLVIIGILIALWLNSLNDRRIDLQESSKLKQSLYKELLENKESFKSYKNYVERCHDRIVAVLNVSAGQINDMPMDTLRSYVLEMVPITLISINNSRLNAAKSSGQYGLLSADETTALALYETTLENYKEARKINNVFNDENRSLFLQFSMLQLYHKRIYPNGVVAKHEAFDLSDEDFLSLIKQKETYLRLSFILTSILVDIAWLEDLDSEIDKTISAIGKEG